MLIDLTLGCMTTTKGENIVMDGLKLPHPVEPERNVKTYVHSGASDGEPLVSWLNENPQTKPRQRVTHIIDLLHAEVRIMRQRELTFPPTTIDRKIERALSRYRFIPHITLTRTGSLLRTPWRLASMAEPFNEQTAVWSLIRLAQLGRVLAVKRCGAEVDAKGKRIAGCNQWYFAKRLDSKTCGSTKCLQRAVRAQMEDDQRAAFNAKRMKRYYEEKERTEARRAS
jgi:hypothetical protein